jgi:NADH dehydrogenase [ubiquinone] 1 alpha subcomplex assembly factor 7
MSTPQFVRYLQDRIGVRGALSMSQFMSECLLNPKFGYYATKHADAILGPRGDFVTSPEISPMFAQVIAVNLVHKWHRLGRPAPFSLLELGPGKATLLGDLLLQTKRSFPEFHNAIGSLSLLEVSPSLRQIQRDKLTPLLPPTARFDHLDAIEQFDSASSDRNDKNAVLNDLIILSHEFYDCLPSNVYLRQNGAWMEKFLSYDVETDQFVFLYRKLDENVRRYFLDHRLIKPDATVVGAHSLDASLLKSHLQPPPDASWDYLELSFEALRIFEHTAQLLLRRGGTQLLIDYGNVSVNYPSLRFILGHEMATSVDSDYIKQNVGNVDLSVDVHFGPLMAIAHKMGITDSYLSSQSAFLFRNGIQALLMRRLTACNDAALAERLIADFRRLTDDEAMGRVYKVYECSHDLRNVSDASKPTRPPVLPAHRKR